MIDFNYCLKEGKAKRIPLNKIRASSLFKSSIQAIETARSIILNTNSAKTVLRELYEGLREYCEAIGFLNGYQFRDHESISYFLRDMLGEPSIYKKFDKYRKLRNGINYYGNDIELETVKESISDIPLLIKKLKKHAHP